MTTVEVSRLTDSNQTKYVSDISTKISTNLEVVFNPMIGPTSNVLIHTGARFTPCMKDVPGLTEQAFASLENTENPPTSSKLLMSCYWAVLISYSIDTGRDLWFWWFRR